MNPHNLAICFAPVLMLDTSDYLDLQVNHDDWVDDHDQTTWMRWYCSWIISRTLVFLTVMIVKLTILLMNLMRSPSPGETAFWHFPIVDGAVDRAAAADPEVSDRDLAKKPGDTLTPRLNAICFWGDSLTLLPQAICNNPHWTTMISSSDPSLSSQRWPPDRHPKKWSQNELQRRLNKMSSNCKSWYQGEASKSWSQGKSSKNLISRRSSKRRSQQSTASSLSLLVMPQHIGINKMLSNPFGKSGILSSTNLLSKSLLSYDLSG